MELGEKQREELKQLRAQLQAMKHGVSKGDKKAKKRISAEMKRMEEEMIERHKREKEDWQSANTSEIVDDGKIGEEVDSEEEQPPSMTRAQKRREKKDAARREAARRIATEEEELEKSSDRRKEWDGLVRILQAQGLTVREIRPDGDCLYNAVADQFKEAGQPLHSGSDLRRLTSDYILSHKDDFMPFLCHADTGEGFSSEQFFSYCNEIANTRTWGGHLEIEALTSVLQCTIEVYQANGPVLEFGEKHNGSVLRLCYHRHEYGLGEHYNSVINSATEHQ